jgi:hypothetical protein
MGRCRVIENPCRAGATGTLRDLAWRVVDTGHVDGERIAVTEEPWHGAVDEIHRVRRMYQRCRLAQGKRSYVDVAGRGIWIGAIASRTLELLEFLEHSAATGAGSGVARCGALRIT